MRSHPLFTIYGLALVGLATVAEYSGWTFTRADQVRGVPRSIRDNPGIYRSIYTGYGRYSGGK